MNLAAVYTTVATLDDAQRIARVVVARSLAACVQIERIDSVYRWQGRVEQEAEFRLMFKTAADRSAELQQAIVELHAYELPAVFAVAVAGAYGPYAAWVVEQTRPPRP